MKNGPTVIAVVSGKGGVGKTVIAANLARVCSFGKKTVLVDLDFPNQGASGLFSEFLRTGCVSSRTLITDHRALEIQPLTEVDDNLDFVPAFDPTDADRFAFSSDAVPLTNLLERVQAMVEVLSRICMTEIIIIDCHGGLDQASFAACVIADHVVVVSEADIVTFNGTLELFDYYMAKEVEAQREFDPDKTSDRPPHALLSSKVLLVINRISSRYAYKGIRKLLEEQISQTSAALYEAITDFLFIPTEPLLSQSLSEYPLFVDLLPESIFCQKLELAFAKIFRRRARIKGRSYLYPILDRIRASRLPTLLTSSDERRSQAISNFYTMSQIGILATLTIATIVSALMFDPLVGSPSFGTMFEESLALHPMFYALTGSMFGLFVILAARVNLLIAGSLRNQTRYEYRLYRRGVRVSGIALAIKLIRLIVTRLYLGVAVTLFISYALINAGFLISKALGLI